jgi:uncharacterized protein YprB with RNaseH-like and TPR domain
VSALADRIRGIVGTTNPAARIPRASPITNPESRDFSPLGGEWRDACFVVERRVDASARYGRAVVGDFATHVNAAALGAPLIASGAPARLPLLFFDLETTGLSGGAGTYAFLVGCGWFDVAGGFVTRQYLLTRFSDERPLLAAVTAELERAGTLVTFNGKSFDAPVIETRYLFHRLEWTGARLPHVDVLHPARRFWGLASSPRRAVLSSGEPSCSLVSLEQQILRAGRTGDVPGFEIPARYFQFVRSGDARPLEAVLQHNRLDLLSLAGLTARLLDMVQTGPDAAHNAREALALGGLYARAGHDARALGALQRAVEMSTAGDVKIDRVDSLRTLAVALRRARRFEEAAGCWRRLLDEPSCPPPCAREANEALAIHHEHRLRDLTSAKTFALRSLEHEPRPAWHQAVRHRIARIERRMERRVEGATGGATLNLD